MTTKRTGRATPGTDVLARTVPLLVEKHYFGESRSANLAPVQLTGEDGKTLPAAEQAQTKALLNLRKKLLNCEETRRVRYRDGDFKDYLKGVATPFRPGLWLVPQPLTDAVANECARWERERGELVEAACERYPQLVASMRGPLGTMFKASDYPPVEVFRARYWVEWRYVDFGVSKLIAENTEVFRREREKLERQSMEASVLIEQHLRGGLLEITRHLRGLLEPKASGKRVYMREGCLDRLNEFLGTVDTRNTTGDADLSRVVRTLRTLGKRMDLEVLREDEAVRDEVAAEMAKVCETLDRLVQAGPARGIRVRAEEVA